MPSFGFQYARTGEGYVGFNLWGGPYSIPGDASECRTIRDTIAIEQQPPLALGLPADTLACLDNGPLLLSAAPGFDSYRWSTGDTGRELVVTAYGDYELEAAYSCGQELSTVRVSPPPGLALSLPVRLEAPLGESVALQPIVNRPQEVSYSWWPAEGLSCTDCPSPQASPEISTHYELVVADKYGCTVSAAVEVVVLPRKRIYVPNAFSPNGDGVNGRLSLYAGQEAVRVIRFEVYNRWGGRVFSAYNIPPNDPAAGWDGRRQERPAPAGLYAWETEVELLDGRRVVLKGEVVLVR